MYIVVYLTPLSTTSGTLVSGFSGISSQSGNEKNLTLMLTKPCSIIVKHQNHDYKGIKHIRLEL